MKQEAHWLACPVGVLDNGWFTNSPYGKQHKSEGFDDLINHFRHRQQVELRIINEVIKEQAVILPAKRWKIEEVINLIKG